MHFIIWMLKFWLIINEYKGQITPSLWDAKSGTPGREFVRGDLLISGYTNLSCMLHLSIIFIGTKTWPGLAVIEFLYGERSDQQSL